MADKPLDDDSGDLTAEDLSTTISVNEASKYGLSSNLASKPVAYTQFMPNSASNMYATNSLTAESLKEAQQPTTKWFKWMEIVAFTILTISELLQIIQYQTYAEIIFHAFLLSINIYVLLLVADCELIITATKQNVEILLEDYGIIGFIVVELCIIQYKNGTNLEMASIAFSIITWICVVVLLIVLIASKCDLEVRI